ncbi:hypothetical protein CLAIMM_12136, partial [Cladophialophora immunda]
MAVIDGSLVPGTSKLTPLSAAGDVVFFHQGPAEQARRFLPGVKEKSLLKWAAPQEDRDAHLGLGANAKGSISKRPACWRSPLGVGFELCRKFPPGQFAAVGLQNQAVTSQRAFGDAAQGSWMLDDDTLASVRVGWRPMGKTRQKKHLNGHDVPAGGSVPGP